MQSSEVSRVAPTSSHSMKVNEDISISADSPVKTSEVSSVKKSCSRPTLEEFFDEILAKKRGDGISCDDKCFDDNYEIQQEPDHLTNPLVNSHEVDGDDERNLSRKSTSLKSR